MPVKGSSDAKLARQRLFDEFSGLQQPVLPVGKQLLGTHGIERFGKEEALCVRTVDRLELEHLFPVFDAFRRDIHSEIPPQ